MFTLTGKWLFSFNSSFKDSCGALFLVCSNEALELLLFNLLGIELDVPPIFTQMEMKLVWLCTYLSMVLIDYHSGLLMASVLLVFFMYFSRKLNA